VSSPRFTGSPTSRACPRAWTEWHKLQPQTSLRQSTQHDDSPSVRRAACPTVPTTPFTAPPTDPATWTAFASPTWAPAKGGEVTGGARYFGASKQYSARDISAHTILKTRKDGQDSVNDLADRDLRAELEERERKHYHKKR
jgi:hypothetical protein